MDDETSTAAETLGSLIDRRANAYEAVKLAEAGLRALKQVVDELDDEIMQRLDDADLPGARGHLGSMSVVEAVVPNVKDWGQLYAYIKENDYFHLLNRAPNAAAFRELFARGDVPGVEPFTKRSLKFKSL
jgi:hypothetical protein